MNQASKSVVLEKRDVANKSRKKYRKKFVRRTTCQVCGDVANDHNHYGAVACYSCRAFFRRISAKSNRRNYVCNSIIEACEINVKTRRQCLHCRYKKCQAVGMRPDWVMSDEDKQDLRRKLETESKRMTNYEERMR